jgi:hypothetical protein
MLKMLFLLVLTLVGCANAEEEQKKLAAIQKAADERVAKAQNEAKVKLGDAERELNELKTQLADAKAKTDEALTKAQASAEEQAKAAEAALAKARQAFKDKARLQLADTNKELAEVSSKAGKVPAKSKAAFTKAMQDVSKQQKAVAKVISDFDTATVDSFKTVNAKVQSELAILKAKIRAARAKIPS